MAKGRLIHQAWLRSCVHTAGIPVLAYHRIRSTSAPNAKARERKYWVSQEQFAGHLTKIRQLQCKTLQLKDLSSGHTVSNGGLATILTFDDGTCADYETAYPLLMNSGILADFFINTASVGTGGYLNWTQIAQMHRSGMSFQSHSHDHVYLTRLPTWDLRRQLETSKKTIEDRLGAPVKFLAVPYGDYNAQVLSEAGKTGYDAVCTSRNWLSGADTVTIPRVTVYSSTTSRTLHRLLVGDPVIYFTRAVRRAVLHWPKQIWIHFRNQQTSIVDVDSQVV